MVSFKIDDDEDEADKAGSKADGRECYHSGPRRRCGRRWL